MLSIIQQKKDEKNARNSLKHAENAAYNEKTHALWDQFEKLPICVLTKSLDDKFYILTNGINSMSLFYITDDGKNHINIIPNPLYTGGSVNYCRSILDPDAAQKLLDLWTLMSRPYFMMQWTTPEERANEASSQAVMDQQPN